MKNITLGSIILSFTIIANPLHAAETNVQSAVGQNKSSEQQDIATPEVILRKAITALTEQFKSGVKQEQMLAFLKKEIVPYFDFSYMAQLAAGYSWNSLEEKQQLAFINQFQQTFFQALAGRVSNLSNPQIQFYPSRPGINPNEAVVSIQVIQAQGIPVLMDFRFYRSEQGWKVFDIMADGSSAVLYYRRFYAELANRYGAKALLGNN